MFKKLKEKITEEVKSSPQRLQQFTQSVTDKLQSSSTDENFFSIGEDDISGTDNMESGFSDVSLKSEFKRRSSNSSIASDISFLPHFESSSLYHLQSDLDISASEVEDSASSTSQLGHLSKEQIYSAFQKAQMRYHKYRGRYTDLAKHYKELERNNSKLNSVLVETQDKAIRRVTELKEQCMLEQKAKAHLESALRDEMDEKQLKIYSLETKIGLLQKNTDNDTHSTTNFDSNEDNSKQLDVLQNSLSEAQKEIETLNEKLQEMKANAIVFQSREQDNKTRITNLEKEIQIFNEREKENNLKLAQIKMELHNEILSKDVEIGNLKKTNNSLVHELQQQSELFESETKSNSKLNNLQNQNKNLIEKLENATQKNNNLESELLKLQKYESENVQINELNVQLKANQDKLQKDIENISEKYYETVRRINSLHSILNLSKEKCTELKNQKKVLLNDIKEENIKFVSEFVQIQNLIKEELQKFGETSKEKELLLQENLNERIKYNDSISKMKTDINEKEEMIKVLQEKLDNITVTFDEKNANYEKIDNEYLLLKEENDRLKAKVAELNNNELNYSSKISTLESTLGDREKQEETYIEKLNLLANEKSELINSLHKTKEEHELVINTLNAQYKELQNNVQIIEDLNQTLKEENCSLKNEISQLQDQVQRLQEKLELSDKEKVDIKVSLENAILNKDLEISNLKEDARLASAKSDKSEEDKIEQLTKEKEEIKDENINLKQQLQFFTDRFNEVDSEYKKLLTEYESVKLTCNDQNEEISNSVEQQNQIQKELKEKILIYIKLKNEFDRNQEHLKTCKNEIEQLNKSLNNVQSRYEKQNTEIEILNKTIETLEYNYKLSVSEKKEADIHLTNLGEKLKQIENDKSQILIDLQSMKLKCTEVENVQQDMSELENKLRIALEENQKLPELHSLLEEYKIRSNELTAKNVDLDKSCNELDVKNKELKTKLEQLKTDNRNMSEENKRILEELDKLKLDLENVMIKTEVNITSDTVSNVNVGNQTEMEKLNYNENLMEEIQNLNKNYNILEEKYHTCVGQKDVYELENEKIMNQLKDLLKEKQLLVDQISELQVKSERLLGDTINSAESQDLNSNTYNEELDSLRKKLIEYKSLDITNKTSIEFYENELEKMKIKNEKLNRKLDETLITLNHCTELSNSTEIEYLRNVLYNYMLGKESLVLARVIAAVCKFDQKQTEIVLQKEQQKQTILGQLGIL